MNYNEAVIAAHAGCFITHKNFDSEESLHYYKGYMYTEDGAKMYENDIPISNNFHDGWEIKAEAYLIDKDTLETYHKLQDKDNLMISFYDKSYEDCITKYEVVAPKHDLYYLIGKSGSGKDYTYGLFLKLFEDYNIDCTPIVTYTTRPKRVGEVDGITYNFINKEDEDKLNILEKRTYDVINSDGNPDTWDYMTCSDNIDMNENHICIGTPESLFSLIEADIKDKFNIYAIYISSDADTRFVRQMDRENNPNKAEIVRRLNTDNADFAPDVIDKVKSEVNYTYTIHNNMSSKYKYISDVFNVFNDILTKSAMIKAFKNMEEK